MLRFVELTMERSSILALSFVRSNSKIRSVPPIKGAEGGWQSDTRHAFRLQINAFGGWA